MLARRMGGWHYVGTGRLKKGRRVVMPGGAGKLSSEVVTYQLDDAMQVRFEIEPPEGFRPAGAWEVFGRVREAVAPAIEAAREVLEKAKEIRPDGVEVRFGVKVSGGANWLVAKVAGEGNFEITLTWSGHARAGEPDGG